MVIQILTDKDSEYTNGISSVYILYLTFNFVEISPITPNHF